MRKKIAEIIYDNSPYGTEHKSPLQVADQILSLPSGAMRERKCLLYLPDCTKKNCMNRGSYCAATCKKGSIFIPLTFGELEGECKRLREENEKIRKKK